MMYHSPYSVSITRFIWRLNFYLRDATLHASTILIETEIGAVNMPFGWIGNSVK